MDDGNTASYKKRMLQGAAIGLLLIIFFLLSANKPNPDSMPMWWLRPLLVVPFAGAMGGLGFYLSGYYGKRLKINKAVLILLGLFGFLVALWLGMVVGLDGTYWN